MTTGIQVPATITCVDCGGDSHLLNAPDPDDPEGPQGWLPGDVATYRCAECADRWDIVVSDVEDDAAS